jgi:hypothetical protein
MQKGTKVIGLGVALALLCARPTASAFGEVQDQAPNIRVLACSVTSSPDASHMFITFRNDTTDVLNLIVWRGAYGSGWIDFTDKGSFAPGTVVTHDLRRFFTTFKPRLDRHYSRVGVDGCTVVRTIGSGGVSWTYTR